MARSSIDYDDGLGGLIYENETGNRFEEGFNETSASGIAQRTFTMVIFYCQPWLILPALLTLYSYAPF